MSPFSAWNSRSTKPSVRTGSARGFSALRVVRTAFFLAGSGAYITYRKQLLYPIDYTI